MRACTRAVSPVAVAVVVLVPSASSSHVRRPRRPPAPAPEGVTPAGPGAKSYAPSAAADGRPAPPADPLRAQIVEEVRAAARKLERKPPEPDRRLDWAMTDLARHVRGEELPALEAVQFLTAHYGLVEPPPHILLSHAPAAGAAEIPRARAAS